MASRTAKGPETLVCVGDLVEDIIIWQRTAAVRGTDNDVRITRGRGGSAANVAAFAAAAAPSRFIGRVGDDDTGRLLTGQLVQAGVDVRVQRCGRTGTVVVLVDETAQRTMFPDRAAAAELQDVPDAWLADVAILHITSYALAETASAAALLGMVRVARAAGARISLDASSCAVIRALGSRWSELLRELRPDIFFANEDESELVPVALITDGGGWYVAKRGQEPVVVHRSGTAPLLVAVEPVSEVIDTTGAGDAFAAGFLTACVTGVDIEGCVRTGNRFASTVLRHPGASGDREWPPDGGAAWPGK